MSGERRCPICDRVGANCPTLDVLVRSTVAASEARRIALASMRDCRANAVDWRTRCLAAERDRDEAVARAERAEAECGAMRAVVEAAERQDVAYEEKDARRAGHRGQHGPADPVAYERARSAYEIACARTCDAVDEWRRTRQSKEGT